MPSGDDSFDRWSCDHVPEPGSTGPSCSRRIAELETEVARLATANAILRRMAVLLLAPADGTVSSAAETP
jgi:hypothetical protein